MFSSHLLQLVGRISFRYFGISCFVYIVFLFIDIFAMFRLSLVLSGLFPQVIFSCVASFFLSLHVTAFFPLFYHFSLFS